MPLKLTVALISGLLAVAPGIAQAADVVEEWATAKMPTAPALKPVTADPKTTALLMLDFMNQNCGARPRCVSSVRPMKALLDKTRAAKATIVYSYTSTTTAADVIKDVAPESGEPSVTAPPDKFLRSDLEKILKDKGITTVIVAGTAAHGAVLYTASSAALRGFNVIVPVDGLSANDTYTESAVVSILSTAPTVGTKTTITRSDMIKF